MCDQYPWLPSLITHTSNTSTTLYVRADASDWRASQDVLCDSYMVAMVGLECTEKKKGGWLSLSEPFSFFCVNLIVQNAL